MKRNEALVATAIIMLVAYTLALSAVGQVSSSFETKKKISNTGALKTIGVGVYWDLECTSPVFSIDWGAIGPGSSENVACYIRNEGDSASILSWYTSNWNPSNASDYMAFDLDYGGQPIDPGEVVQVTFWLSVSVNIEGITSFSFDITIFGTG